MKHLLLAFTLLLVPLSVSAATFQAGNAVDVKTDGNAYAAGSLVQVSKSAPGDVYLAGETVQINAHVREDAMLAGENVTINAPIGDDLHAFGANVMLNNTVRGDVIIFGQQVLVAPESRVFGSAIIGAQSVVSQGRFDRDLRIMAADIEVAGIYAGDVKLHVGESLEIHEDAQIRGDLLLSLSEDAAIIIPEGVVRGEVKKQFTPVSQKKTSFLGGFKILSFLSRLVIGALIIAFARLFAVRYGEGSKEEFWKRLGIGLLGLLAPPFVATLLFFPVITIPLGILTFVLWGTLLYLGSVFAGFIVVNLFFPFQEGESALHIFGKFALGTLLISAVRIIPFVGFLAVLILYLLSIGALITYETGAAKALRKADLL
jgi:hypothetical protein